jgi:hypothetical protein
MKNPQMKRRPHGRRACITVAESALTNPDFLAIMSKKQ